MSAASSPGDLFHIESHAVLLQQRGDAGADTDPGQQRELDAIVVPTIRPGSLGPAIELAHNTGCALVVLCTTADQAGRVACTYEQLPGQSLVSYVSPALGQEGPLALTTSQHPENDAEPSCHIDIARKRNVGLLLARMLGWDTIMFLDDDIRGMTARKVARAAAMTGQFPAVGFAIDCYPDNSVVCHAHRLAGGAQGVFPGGSALLVDVHASDMHFPSIYNEDWLFLFDAAQRRSVAVAGTLSQLEYRPFARPRRAAAEEFGDVIAEGLYRLLHEGGTLADATDDYWRETLARRLRLIDHVAAQLLARADGAPEPGYALMSLVAARRRLTGITELSCRSFIRAWQADLEGWRKKLTDLPVLADLAGAAQCLGLPALNRCVT
jgi:hypothetical protein